MFYLHEEDHVDYVGGIVTTSDQKFLIVMVEDEDAGYADYFLTAP